MTASWFRPTVAVAMIGGGLLTIVLPVVVAAIIRRRTGATWRTFGIGVATFFVSQGLLRLPWQIPLGLWLGPRIASSTLLLGVWLAVSALTAALFEEVGRFVAMRRFQADERSWRVGVMMGAGHGGLEAIIVGVIIVASGVSYLLIGTGAVSLPPGVMDKMGAQYAHLGPIDALAGVLERVIAVASQIAMSAVVAESFVRGRTRWLAFAIGLHFGLDSVFAGAAMAVAKRTGSPMLGELPLLPALPIAVWIVWRLRPTTEPKR